MRAPRSVVAIAMASAVTTVVVASSAVPAFAGTAIGVADNFYGDCDASVYVSDEVVGSAGKVEAWGGYSCPSTFTYVGQLKIVLYKNGVSAGSSAKNVKGSTDSVSTTATNTSGVQSWRADLTIFRPGSDSVIVSTGVVRS